jgi:flagellar basal-body rod protein FlgB
MEIFDTTQAALAAAMTGAAQRQNAIADNIANVDTPGYQRKDVDFHATLQQALQTGQPLDGVAFSPTVDGSRSVRADGSGVDPDQESADLAENSLEYEALVQVAGARTNILQIAMGVR